MTAAKLAALTRKHTPSPTVAMRMPATPFQRLRKPVAAVTEETSPSERATGVPPDI